MHRRQWMTALLVLSALCVAGIGASAQDFSLRFSGQLVAGQGVCEQISDRRISCQIPADSSATLELTATVSPADFGVIIGGGEMPSWVSLVPASGYGSVSTHATIHAPSIPAGGHDQTVLLMFTATAAHELQVQFEVELVITEAAAPSGEVSDLPYQISEGTETDQGIQFEIPFLAGFSAFVVGDVTDCETGDPIDASRISTEFIFPPTSQPPHRLADLEEVLVNSPGYRPYVIRRFQPLSINLLFMQITLLLPAESAICLNPVDEEPVASPGVLPVEEIGEIRLLSPLASEGLEPSASGLRFCWESLGRPGTTYEVFHVSKACDPDVVEGPHPFAPLIPDPTLSERRQTLRNQRSELERKLADLEEYCPKLATTFAQIEQRLSELTDVLASLEAGRDAAERAQAGPFELALPPDCSKDIAALLAPHPASFDDIQPCEPCECRTLADRLAGMIWTIQSLDARAAAQTGEFERLLERWVNGADHRGVFEVYHVLFSTIDSAIQFINDILDELTLGIAERIQAAIEDHLTSAACSQHPEWCETIEAAQTVRGRLEAIRGLMQSAKSTGTPSPAFMVQMVQAMAQQASAATAVAVEGWQHFAEYMGAVLWDAYESVLCTQQAWAWLLAHKDQIQALCDACRECVAQEIIEIDEELAEIAAEERAAVAARQAYWQEQAAEISSGIEGALALLGTGWYDQCCTAGSERIEIPGESRCAQLLEEALKQVLGDKACFLTFTFECQPNGGITFEFSRPLAERRPCCCVPCARQRTLLGSQPDPGRSAESVCHPRSSDQADETRDRVDELGPGGWQVEAYNPEGERIASSPRRDLGPGAITMPFPRLPDPLPHPGCICSISASINGVLVAGGGTVSDLVPGVPASIAVTADCGPACAAGASLISIQPPLTWINGPTGLVVIPPPPISIAGSHTLFDFPEAGVYTVTVSHTCEDGQRCASSFSVSVTAPPGPVARMPRQQEAIPCCPACANDACLEMAYRRTLEQPLMPLPGCRLILDRPTDLTLRLASDCRTDCPPDRMVRWEITDPADSLTVVEGPNQYEIVHAFTDVGEYLLCVIETVPCAEGDLRFEKWLVVEVSRTE